MNRRELLKTIAALPALKSVEVARLEPDDVIVVTASERLSPYGAERLYAALEKLWPGRRCLILPAGVTLKVVKGQ